MSGNFRNMCKVGIQ